MKEFALFIGCTIATRGLNYEASARRVAAALGIGLVDVPGFACCGYPMSHVDYEASMAMAARNLAEAEALGLEVVTLCSACTGMLTKASKTLAGDEAELERVNDVLRATGRRYLGRARVRHLSRVLIEDVGVEAIRRRVVRPLSALRVAPHYGCHYERPGHLFDGFDSPKRPRSLHALIAATGASPVDYMCAHRCCGGDILAIDERSAMRVVNEKLRDVRAAGADAIALHCPFCSIMYDEYQATIEEAFQERYGIPVLYITQLIGLAMGFDPKKELGLGLNSVKPKTLLTKAGVV
ncbi:MAG: CoB--CoM heterodisulfide reductase iron-sulfur subunit B family protein [Thermoplasmatota archaeon]